MKIMPHRIAKKQRSFCSRQLRVIVLVASLITVVPGIGLAQVVSPAPATPQKTNSKSIPSSEDFFADILVLGQPVFQVGSLSDLSASEQSN